MIAKDRWIIVSLIVTTWLAQPSPAHAEPPVKGYVIVAGGIGGIDCVAEAAKYALPKAGVSHQIINFDWTHGKGHFFKDLLDTPHLLERSNELARSVRALKAEAPEKPIYLIGKSGGAGLVLAAAEQLPPNTVERIILLSAAVSPTYDLRPALLATRREIVSYYSPYDQLILGWGTREFGTIDRVFGPSAGLKGFVAPAGISEEDVRAYQRLVQVPWKLKMILAGHPGNHMGTSMPGFVGAEVAKWLK